MTTVQQVFDAAIMLMDQQSEANGRTLTEDNQEYHFRTLHILATLLPQLGVQAQLQLPEDPAVPDFSQFLPLEDGLCLGVLPYGLAASLLAGENEQLATWFQNRFRESTAALPGGNASMFCPIQSPYGLF